MKKIQSLRLEAFYCNADDTRVRRSPEIQANYQIKTVQVTNVKKNQEIPLEECFR